MGKIETNLIKEEIGVVENDYQSGVGVCEGQNRDGPKQGGINLGLARHSCSF